MEGSPRPVQVIIQGKPYVLQSDDPPEHLQRVADIVDEALSELTGGRPNTQYPVAILAAMNIASELLKARTEMTDLKSDLDSRARTLIELIDERLASSDRS